jgi:hypothetical protein
MTTYPLTLPSVKSWAAGTRMGVEVAVGVAESPFTLSAQRQIWGGARWVFQGVLPIMVRADAEEWIAFRQRLRGPSGSFLLGYPGYTTPRGTWAGSPVADTAGSPTVNRAGDTDLFIRGLSNGATVKAGDMFQLGSGAASRLHKNLTAQTAGASGRLMLDVDPPLREVPTDGLALVTNDPKGVFMLTDTTPMWTLEEALHYAELGLSALEVVPSGT